MQTFSHGFPVAHPHGLDKAALVKLPKQVFMVRLTLAKQRGQNGNAIQPLKRALELKSDLLGVRQMLGYALLAQGYAAEAIPYLEASKSLDANTAFTSPSRSAVAASIAAPVSSSSRPLRGAS